MISVPQAEPPPRTQINFRNAITSPLGSINLAGFGIRQTVALSEWRVFGQYALVYVLDGKGSYDDASGRPRPLETGDLILVFPELAHRYNPMIGTTWTVTFICFDGPVFDLWRQQGIIDPKRPIYHLDPVDVWSRRLESVFTAPRQANFAPPIIEICRLQNLLAEVVTGEGCTSNYQDDLRWASRARGLIEAELGSYPDWDKIAGQLGLTVEGFRKRFTRLVGQPPARFRMARLIDRACELIQEHRLTDKQIALSLGFCDEFYFSRRFKAVTGKSPRAFRRALEGRLDRGTRS